MSDTISRPTIKVMCEAWREMNTIRWRDGVPFNSSGTRSDIAQEYWDDIMERLDKAVMEATGQKAWLHPSLFEVTEQTMHDLLVKPHL